MPDPLEAARLDAHAANPVGALDVRGEFGGHLERHVPHAALHLRLELAPVGQFHAHLADTAGDVKLLDPELVTESGRLDDQIADAARHVQHERALPGQGEDRKSTRLNSSHVKLSYAVFCLKQNK